MTYQVLIKRPVEKELERLPVTLRKRILRKLLDLELIPRPKGVKKLQGEDSYRLRIGDYRILYTIDDQEQIVRIFAIGHRREIYQ